MSPCLTSDIIFQVPLLNFKIDHVISTPMKLCVAKVKKEGGGGFRKNAVFIRISVNELTDPSLVLTNRVH